jgi:hypothetical protein
MPASPFWADYAAHDGRQPFLSPHFPEATRNVNEMLMVLAVLDLPFEPAVHKEAITGTQYVLTAGSPLMVFHRQIAEATAVETGEVMVAQHFFRADEADGGAALDEYLPQVPYGARVLLTNPSQDRQTLSALLQIPAGAIPLKDGFYTRRVDVALDPYASATIEYFFYFPATGVFRHYPATLARAGAVVARAAPATFTVVAQARHVDKTSWDWIAENGSEADVVAYLEREAGSGAGYEEIAWRMRDRAFFKKVTGLLEARHIYSGTLWAYSLLHNDVPALRAYVAESELAYKCGGYLDSPLLVVEPAERGGYQHFEYAPLVNPRAHRLGGKHRILDAGLLAQYGRLMGVLSWKAVLSDADELEVAYYMMLQDRVAEALDWFSRVDRKAVAEHLQYDYLDVYLAFYRGDTQGARRIAMRHLTEPVDRWRNRFEQAVAQLDEAEKGGDAAVTDPESRDQDQGALAAAAPWLELQVEAGRIRLDYRNMKSCTLNFYPMDIEVLFSQSPFMQEQKASFAFVRPAVSRTVELEGGKEFVEIELPAEFRTRNVMVEARGAGLRKSQGYYANTLKVQFAEAYGQLLVQHAGTRKPVVGAYVKVYARSESGGVTFVKDGYTDLRGRFDYASLNTGEIEEAARLAVLVLSEKDGAVVREVAPPKR